MTPREIEEAQRKLISALPVQACWFIQSVPLRFDFTRLNRVLATASDEFDNLPPLPVDASSLLIFGDQDYADGGGATPSLVLDQVTGSVLALDLESDSRPLQLINSSVDQFVRSFLVLDVALRTTPPVLRGVSDALRAIDPVGFPRSEWFELIDGLE